MHLLVSNDCPFLAKSQIQGLVKWYIAPPHRKITSVTFLCPHLDPNTNLGKSQAKYIDWAMKKFAPEVEHIIVNDYTMVLKDDYYPDYIVYAHFGPSYLEDAYEDNPTPIGKIVLSHLQSEQFIGKRSIAHPYSVTRSETQEAIEYLGTRFLRHSETYKNSRRR